MVDVVLGLLPSHDVLHIKSHLVDLGEHVQTCINVLKMSSVISFLYLIGMRGIDKTCLAKVIYNHLVSKNNFQTMSFLEIRCHTLTNLGVGSC